MKTTITLTPENAATIAQYAKIMGCTQTEFVNRWLDNSLCEVCTDTEGLSHCMEDFEFKTRTEANRVSNWIYELSKKEAAGLGLRLNPKTEIIEDEREPMPFCINSLKARIPAGAIVEGCA